MEEPRTKVLSHRIASTFPQALPDFLIQLTLLNETSSMIWIGLEGVSTNLTGSWSCAMPPRDSSRPAPVTNLFAARSEAGAALAARLSKRFARQIFLSLDLQPILQTGPFSALVDSEAATVLLHLEKSLVEYLTGVFEKSATSNGI